jgi:hypothetical protein
MKHIIKTFLFCATLLSLTTCKKTSLRGDYFIFGSGYSECSGNCVNYYLLKKGSLYADDMNWHMKKLKFRNDALPSDKVNLAEQLKEQIPSLLKSSTEDRFGCPNCLDQGGYYIELRENGETKKFFIDTDTTEIPKELRSFVVNIKSTMRQL